jgi:poly(A) polymerase
LVAAVKLWARRRGIYGARLGFLGGFSYTILAARIAQMYPRADTRELLHQFFAVYVLSVILPPPRPPATDLLTS